MRKARPFGAASFSLAFWRCAWLPGIGLFGAGCTAGNTVFAVRRYHRKNGTAEIHGLHAETVPGRERTFGRFLQNPPACLGILFSLSRRKAFRKTFQKTFRYKKDRKEGRQTAADGIT